MSKYEIVPVNEQHISFLAGHMRDGDVAEIAVSLGVSPAQAIQSAIKKSRHSATALADGEPMAIFGVVTPTVMSSVASPWILSSSIVEKHKRAYMRMSKAMVEDWRKQYRVMQQLIDSRYHEAIKWVEWLGFEAVDTYIVGAEKVPFYLYELRT